MTDPTSSASPAAQPAGGPAARPMTKARWALVFLIPGLPTLLSLIVPFLTLCPLGWWVGGRWRGEPCHGGWPTTYWRHQVARSRPGEGLRIDGKVLPEVPPVPELRDPAAIPVLIGLAEPAPAPGGGWRFDDPFASARAIVTLADLGPGARQAVPTLVRALRCADPLASEWAAYALGEIGPDARAAVPVLLEALRGEGPFAAMLAFWPLDDIVRDALRKIDPDAEPAHPHLGGRPPGVVN